MSQADANTQSGEFYFGVVFQNSVSIPTITPPRPVSAATNGTHINHASRCAFFSNATLERAERAIAALGRGRPFLIVYYCSDGSGGWQALARPLRTLTTLDRFGLVTWEGRELMLRMLQVDELRDAMGFPKNYRFEHGARRDKVKMLGNGVCPPVMEAVVETLYSR
jgi:site-specific DNA-cytosine methylase